MKDHIDAIEKSIKKDNYYSALFLAITLPSVCGALESNDGQDTRQKYIAWYEKYVTDLYLSGEDCYRLRCSLLHQAASTHSDSSYSRIIFTFPVANGATLHNNVLDDALNLDIALFCRQLVSGARKWIEDMKGNQNYEINIVNTMKVYPDGLKPYIKGHPIIS